MTRHRPGAVRRKAPTEPVERGDRDSIMRVYREQDRQSWIGRWQRAHPGEPLTPAWEARLADEWEGDHEYRNVYHVTPPSPGFRPWPNPFRPWPYAADGDS